MYLTHGSSHLAVHAYDLQPSCQATQRHLELYKPNGNKFDQIRQQQIQFNPGNIHFKKSNGDLNAVFLNSYSSAIAQRNLNKPLLFHNLAQSVLKKQLYQNYGTIMQRKLNRFLFFRIDNTASTIKLWQVIGVRIKLQTWTVEILTNKKVEYKDQRTILNC